MPQLDMPLEELRKYKGISPCPDDMNRFWDQALAETDSMGTGFEWQETGFSSPVAECRHLNFKAPDGNRIHVKAVLPVDRSRPVPALLHFHGYTMSSLPWSEYIAWAASGMAVFAMDCRGQGGLSEDLNSPAGPTLFGNIVRGLEGRPEDLHYRRVFMDTVQLARIVMAMPDIDEERLGAFGGSQGGALTLACAALEPRISVLAPLYPFLSDYKRVWEMDLAKRAYVGLSDYFRKFDPLHEREQEIFNTLGYIDIANLADRIRGRVLFGLTLMDDICPPSTQFAAFNRIESEKELLLFHDYGHENIPVFKDKTYRFFCKNLLK